jgi:hypothetical protein
LRRRALVALLVLLGVVVISNTTYRKRKQQRAILEDREDSYVAAVKSGRLVDFGVLLFVVERDAGGAELVAGAPRMRIVREHRFGGMVDTRTRPRRLVGPSQNPVVWFCSEDQERILLNADTDKPAQLVYGSEGAGKTTVLAQWHALQVIRHIGERREAGQTAPTLARLESLLNEMRRLYPPSWYSYRTSRRILRFKDLTGIRLVSTHRRSKSAGSPLQSFNWSWLGDDEIQDSTAEVDNGTARLRTARGGAMKAPRLGTATAKDDTDWRNCRDKLESSGLWVRRTLLGTRSPFVHPDHWEAMRVSMSPREYQRRVLAMDVGPERMTYPTWSRANLVRIPDIGWFDCTASELAPWGRNLGALVGHDPGTLFDVSLIIKAYRAYPAQVRPFWVVRAEVTTEQTTTEQHVVTLLDVARRQFQLNMFDWQGRPQTDGAQMLVRADPYGNTDSRPDRSIYTIFRNAGVTIHPAAYSANGAKPGRVPQNEGIDLVCTLLCNAADERRLFVEVDALGQPVAPRLVRALESSERDLSGKAETQRKNEHDQSHWPAALRYALWAIERPRLAAAAGLR